MKNLLDATHFLRFKIYITWMILCPKNMWQQNTMTIGGSASSKNETPYKMTFNRIHAPSWLLIILLAKIRRLLLGSTKLQVLTTENGRQYQLTKNETACLENLHKRTLKILHTINWCNLYKLAILWKVSITTSKVI